MVVLNIWLQSKNTFQSFTCAFTRKDRVTNPPIPYPAWLQCAYSVFLGNFGEWPYGATNAAVLQPFLFSCCRGAVQDTDKFNFSLKFSECRRRAVKKSIVK
jgi:hypothetical protein